MTDSTPGHPGDTIVISAGRFSAVIRPVTGEVTRGSVDGGIAPEGGDE